MALNIHDYRAEISAINTVIGADGKHTIVVEVAGGLNTGGSTVDVSGLATSALQGDTNTALTAINTKLAGTLVVNGSGFTQPVSVSILPLPTGAATSAKQDTGNVSLASIDTKLSGTLTVNGSGVTQPVSAVSLPLPTGAATEATLNALKNAVLAQIEIASTLWTDDSGTFYVRRDTVNEQTGVVTVGWFTPQGNTATPGTGLRPASGVKDYEISSTPYVATAAGTGYSIGDSLIHALVLEVSGAAPTVAASVWLNITTGLVVSPAPAGANIAYQSALPTGASTAALQTTGNTSLASIDTKLGGTLTVNGSGVTQPVSATALPLPTGAATAALQTSGNTSLSSAASALGATTDAASGTDATGSMTHTGLLKRLVLSITSLLTKSDTGNTSLASIDTKLGGTLTVNGSGVTQPVSATALPLPTGAATAALQSSGNNSLTSIDTKLDSQATATLQTSANTLLGQIKTAIETNGSGGGGGASVPTGTAGAPNAAVLSVQGVLGGKTLTAAPGTLRTYGSRPLFYDAAPVVADPGEFFAIETFMGGGVVWTTATGNCVRVVNGTLAIKGSHTSSILVMWLSRYNANAVIGDTQDQLVRGTAISALYTNVIGDLNNVMVLEPVCQAGGYTIYQFDTPFDWFTWDVVANQGRGSLLFSAYDAQMNFTADQASANAIQYAFNMEVLAAPSI